MSFVTFIITYMYFSRNDGEYPPCTPAKLFRVERIKPVKGTPYWERKLLKEFKLDAQVIIKGKYIFW